MHSSQQKADEVLNRKPHQNSLILPAPAMVITKSIIDRPKNYEASQPNAHELLYRMLHLDQTWRRAIWGCMYSYDPNEIKICYFKLAAC